MKKERENYCYLIVEEVTGLPVVCLDTFMECVFWLEYSTATVSLMIKTGRAVKGFKIEKVFL